MGPANLPRLSEISLDARALGFTLVLSLLSGLLFGLIPALKYAGPRISLALRSAGRTVEREPGAPSRPQCFGRRAGGDGPGADGERRPDDSHVPGAANRRAGIHAGGTSPNHANLHSGVADRGTGTRDRGSRTISPDKLAAIPGVTSVGFASEMPMEGFGSMWDAIFAEGKTYPANEIPPLRLYQVCLTWFLSNRRHTNGRGPRSDLDRCLRRQASGDGLRESRARVVGHAVRRASASGSASFRECRGRR